jgi:predicted esterase
MQSQAFFRTMNTPLGNYRFREYQPGSSTFDQEGEGIEVLPQEGVDVSKVVIWMHGLGDSAQGWFSAVPHLNKDASQAGLGVKYILPTAPVMPVTLNMGMQMHAWSDIYSLRADHKRYDEEGLQRSADRINGIIEATLAEHEHLTPQDIVVGGFSQGGAMAYFLGLTCEHPLRSIVTLSAYLPARETLLEQATEYARENLGYLHCHGKSDDIVLFDYGSKSIQFVADELCQDTFEENASDFSRLNFHTFTDMGHEISMPEMDVVSRYLAHRFQDNATGDEEEGKQG